MKILGISAHYHDAAAALVIDGVPCVCGSGRTTVPTQERRELPLSRD
jgi:predicted NodU family carbamoyl transferase